MTPIPPRFLPCIASRYVHPKEFGQKRELEEAINQQVEAALAFLASFEGVPRRSRAYVSSSALVNLGSYLWSHGGEAVRRAFCCCVASEEENVQKPIPEKAYQTLALTREQFDRNTLGVCCIAPAVIIGTPFIPASKIGITLLGIFSGLVILTTAGTNTYVFSGDIGIVPNGRGDLCVEGGIRVDAIEEIGYAYLQISTRLKTKWERATDLERTSIQATCIQIRERWDLIVDVMTDCGLRREAVEKILIDFAQVIGEITQSDSRRGF